MPSLQCLQSPNQEQHRPHVVPPDLGKVRYKSWNPVIHAIVIYKVRTHLVLESPWKLQSVLESPWSSTLTLKFNYSSKEKGANTERPRVKIYSCCGRTKKYVDSRLFSCTEWSPWKIINVSLKVNLICLCWKAVEVREVLSFQKGLVMPRPTFVKTKN